MPTLQMDGPYPLNRYSIALLDIKNVIGNYALGYVNKSNMFIVLYVGRSDGDLKDRLASHIDELPEYTHFKYSIASSMSEAFNKECKNYHDFGGDVGRLNNEIHPDAPNGYSLRCPYCKYNEYLEALKRVLDEEK